jgi:hypothetical protein
MVLLFNMRFMPQTGGYFIFVHKQNNERQVVTPYSTEEETGNSPLGQWKDFLMPVRGLDHPWISLSCAQGQIQVLCSLKLIQFLGPSLRKRIQNYKYEIRYENEYLFRAPARALEGAPANDGP